MRICLVNQSSTPDAQVQAAIRAINAQLVDVAYHWSLVAQCRLEGARYRQKMSLKEVRGDGLIYITDDQDPDALGWHDADAFGLPYGVVYTGWDFEPWGARHGGEWSRISRVSRNIRRSLASSRRSCSRS